MTEAVKCSIAMVVAFSSIVGKVGPLEAFIMCVIGTFGYELNNKIIYRIGMDFGGTFGIFTFGGFMGFGIGIIHILINYRNRNMTKRSTLYTADLTSTAFSMLGALFIFSFFPALVLDPHQNYYQNIVN